MLSLLNSTKQQLKKGKKNRTAFKRFYFIITNTEIGFIGWCPAIN